MGNIDIASVILIIVISIYEEDYDIDSVFETFLTTVGEIVGVYFSIMIGLLFYGLVFPSFEKIIIDALLGPIIEKFELLQLIKQYIEYISGFFSFLWDKNAFTIVLLLVTTDKLLVKNNVKTVLSIVENKLGI